MYDGAPGRIRTCDTRFRRAVLYPLSYEGEPGRDRAIQSLTRRHSPSPAARSQQIVSS